MSISQASVWSDLVIAILSVNNFPLTKTFTLFDALKSNGLFDPANLARWEVDAVARRLALAGYDRGHALNQILAERLRSVGQLADDLEKTEQVLVRANRSELLLALKQVKGVGPQVVDNFLLLRGPTVTD